MNLKKLAAHWQSNTTNSSTEAATTHTHKARLSATGSLALPAALLWYYSSGPGPQALAASIRMHWYWQYTTTREPQAE